MILKMRAPRVPFAGCPVLARTVAAIDHPDKDYLEKAGVLSLAGASGRKYSPEQRAAEIIQFALGILPTMADAIGWSCPELESLRAVTITSEDDLLDLSSTIVEVHREFLWELRTAPKATGKPIEPSADYLMADAILRACLTAGRSVRVSRWVEESQGVAATLLGFLDYTAERRNPKAATTARRKVRRDFLKLLKRLSA